MHENTQYVIALPEEDNYLGKNFKPCGAETAQFYASEEEAKETACMYGIAWKEHWRVTPVLMTKDQTMLTAIAKELATQNSWKSLLKQEFKSSFIPKERLVATCRGLRQSIKNLEELLEIESGESLDLLHLQEALKYAHAREEELRAELTQKGENVDLKNASSLFREKLKTWWSDYGLGYVKEIAIVGSQAKVTFGASFSSLMTFAEDTAEIQRYHQKIEELEEQGVLFKRSSREAPHVVDCDQTRSALAHLFSVYWKSAHIVNFESNNISRTAYSPVITAIHVIFSDLSEIMASNFSERD